MSKKVTKQGEPEQRMTGNQSLKFPSCTIKRVFFPHLNWNGVHRECIQRDTMTGMVAVYHKKEKKKIVATLKTILSLTGSQ